jgi:hypothetical protein
MESSVAEHMAYDEQQKALKEQIPPSKSNNRPVMADHEDKRTESKVSFPCICFVYRFAFYVGVLNIEYTL